MDGVPLLRFREQFTHGSVLRFCGVRGPDHVTQPADRAGGFKHNWNRRTGRHELDQRPVKRPLLMDRVELTCLPLREMKHSECADLETALFQMRDDLSGLTA